MSLGKMATTRLSTPLMSCAVKNYSRSLGHRLSLLSQTSFRAFGTTTSVAQGNETYKQKAEAKIGGVKLDGTTKRWFKEAGISTVTEFLNTEEGGKSAGSGLLLREQSKQEWVILLDGRALRTPKDNRFIVPSQYLAMAIAAEWDAQIEHIKPKNMSLMSIATTVIDHVPITRMMLIGNLLFLLSSDTILFRASEKQLQLKKQQEKLHDPLISWFRDTFNCDLPLTKDDSFRSPDVSEETMSKLRWYLHSQDDWTLGCLDVIANSAKSLVIALAVQHGVITTEEAVAASRAEENVQIEEWGEVSAGHDLDKVGITVNIAAGSAFLKLLNLPKAFQKPKT